MLFLCAEQDLGLGFDFHPAQLLAQTLDGGGHFVQVVAEIAGLLFQSTTGNTGFTGQVNQFVQQRRGDPDGFLGRTLGGSRFRGCLGRNLVGFGRGYDRFFRFGRRFRRRLLGLRQFLCFCVRFGGLWNSACVFKPLTDISHQRHNCVVVIGDGLPGLVARGITTQVDQPRFQRVGLVAQLDKLRQPRTTFKGMEGALGFLVKVVVSRVLTPVIQ